MGVRFHGDAPIVCPVGPGRCGIDPVVLTKCKAQPDPEESHGVRLLHLAFERLRLAWVAASSRRIISTRRSLALGSFCRTPSHRLEGVGVLGPCLQLLERIASVLIPSAGADASGTEPVETFRLPSEIESDGVSFRVRNLFIIQGGSHIKSKTVACIKPL
jgi:hypothetical protein